MVVFLMLVTNISSYEKKIPIGTMKNIYIAASLFFKKSAEIY